MQLGQEYKVCFLRSDCKTKWKEDRIVLYIAIRVPSSDSNDLVTIIFNEPIAPMLAPSLQCSPPL